MKSKMKSYITQDSKGKLLLTTDGSSASVDFWGEVSESWQPLDVSAEFLQSLIDEQKLPLEVGERLGWREMGSQYSGIGYFSVGAA